MDIGNFEDLTGKKFNRLTVLEPNHFEETNYKRQKRKLYWKCQCDCGNICYVASAPLKSGKVKSCGCLKSERIKETKHKTNKYDLESEEYGIGYASNSNRRFIFDKDDYDKIKDVCWLDDGRYIAGYINGKSVRLHNFLMPNVSMKNGIYVDHINRDKYDDRRQNLRYVTPTENARNSSMTRLNTSGVTGVWWSNKDNYWVVQIDCGDGKTKTISTTKNATFEEAVKLRLEAELKYFGRDFAPQRHLFEKYGVDKQQ